MNKLCYALIPSTFCTTTGAIINGKPVTGDDGGWLLFDTYEEAFAEASKHGLDHRHVHHVQFTRLIAQSGLDLTKGSCDAQA